MTPPLLAIVVDTEEEFDWSAPFDRASRSVANILEQHRAHEIYAALGMVPTYVIDHPVASDDKAVAALCALQQAGDAVIGTHLHPWVNPPETEAVNTHNSFHCNLPPALERAKMAVLTDLIAERFGARPTIFKAGRYGFGANTQAVLVELGYRIDCSFVAHSGFAAMGGPDFCGKPAQPHWLDEAAGLLEIPLTTGFTGALAPLGPGMAPLFDSPQAIAARLPGILGRTGMLSRTRLTPEGVPAAELCKLLDVLVARGQRIFTMAYHSSSLLAGGSPYARTAEDVAAFCATIRQVLTHFRDRLGGRFITLDDIYDGFANPGQNAK